MYLEALITKWRPRKIRFEVEILDGDLPFRVTALMLDTNRYTSVKCMYLAEGCQAIDESLIRILGGPVDTHRTNAGEKQVTSKDSVRPANPGAGKDSPRTGLE